ncbi:alpha/beta hydrolase [Halobacteriales archaeon QH_7_66_37]|nr:MAG: alpha/beta hydrolase [Halobacteriales archaeon QH_7_66_37]
MPTTTAEGVDLFYETAGDGETVTFVGEAGYGAWQWGWQAEALTGPYGTLVWDLRGTGRSDCPPGPYSVDRLAADLEAVLSAAEADRTHLVGAGLGGMVALAYAREYDRARSLTLCGAAPDGGEVNENALRSLHAPTDDGAAIRDSLVAAFSEEFLTEQDDLVAQICEWRAADDATREGFEAQVAAALDFEAPPLYEVSLPALVFQGVDDPVVPTSAGRSLAADLPRGTFEAVEGRRLHFVEHARAVSDRLAVFLDDV